MKKNAFTLIEILVTIALSTAVIAASFTLFSLTRKSYYKTLGSFDNRQNARIALERISRDLRQTEEVVTQLPPDNSNPATLPNSILFQDGHATTNIHYIEYSLAGDEIIKKIIHYSFGSDPDIWVHWNALDGTGTKPQRVEDSNQVLAENISSLKFWGAKLITISLSTNASSDNQFETKVLGRNIQ